VTLSDESEEEVPESENFPAFVSPHVEEEDSYYSEHSENEEELKEAYKTLYIEYEKLREGRKQHLNDLNSLQTEKSSLMLKVQEFEEKLLETQLQLERVTDEKLTRMLSIQKSPNDKTGLKYVASSSDIPSSSKTVFVKPTVPELSPAVEDKQKEKVNDDVPGTQQPHSVRRPPICHHCGLDGHVRPQCSLLKAQKAKAKKEAPRQLIMALDLRLSIRLLGIRHPINYHGDKHQGISIKPLGLMLLSISGLSSGLYQPITVAPTRANPSK
jgi:hypothetical protein